MYVDAVEERARDAGEIVLLRGFGAFALVNRVEQEAAGAGIHGTYEHYAARICRCYGISGDCYFSIFERLSERLKGGSGEERELV